MSNTYNADDKPQTDTVEQFDFDKRPPIRGYPELHWGGKRPFTSTHFYPAQLKEQHGSEVDGWLNKIFWGDNLQVMSHLLKHYRERIDLIYIDPPFDSKVDYKKRITLKGKQVENDRSIFEEGQYSDIWNNDEYLQFVFERLILIRELLSDKGSVYVHVDWRMNSLLRLICDQVFGKSNFRNEVRWRRQPPRGAKATSKQYARLSDVIIFYSKSDTWTWNGSYKKYTPEFIRTKFRPDSNGRLYRDSDLGDYSEESISNFEKLGRIYLTSSGKKRLIRFLDEEKGEAVGDMWIDIPEVNSMAEERTDYPTQKPERLLERIIRASTNPGDIVLDCFMGSGTTQAVAMKLGRRFLGADINLGAIHIATKRLISVAEEIQNKQKAEVRKQEKLDLLSLENEAEEIVEEVEVELEAATFYTGFEVYNVNNYEIFRNPIEAKDILIEALELQKLQAGHLFDGERDGRMWKIMPVNKIATRQDLNEIIASLNLKSLTDRLQAAPNQPAEKITLVCMGHEPDLAATLNQEVALNLGVKAGTKMPLDVQVLDILRDRGDLQFKRDSEAKVAVVKGQLVIQAFYPMNLLSKLSLEKEKVEDWREMVDSVMVDFNYDGAVFNPALVDIPEKNALVGGSYPVPDDAGTIRVKITDVLSESLELEVHG